MRFRLHRRPRQAISVPAIGRRSPEAQEATSFEQTVLDSAVLVYAVLERPSGHTVQEIAAALDLSSDDVARSVDQLASQDLLARSGDLIRPSQPFFHQGLKPSVHRGTPANSNSSDNVSE